MPLNMASLDARCALAILSISLLLGCFPTSGQNPHSISHERKLREDLFGKRNRTAIDIRPVANYTDRLTVKVALHLVHLTHLNVQQGIMSVLTYTLLMWTDASLTWNSKDYGGVDSLQIPSHLLWKPDLTLYNHRTSGAKKPKGNFKIIIYPDGSVLWVPKFQIDSKCSTDVVHFPYDEHECIIKFGSWTFDGYMIDVVLMHGNNPKMNIQTEDMKDTSNEWELVRTSSERHEKYYSCCAEPYPDVTFTLVLKRRSAYYTLTAVIPSLLVLFLILASFWLPPVAEEKITLGCFNVLYLVLLLGLLHWTFPRNSLNVTNMVKFVSSLFVVAIISLVSNVLTVARSRRHHLSVPPRFCRMVFGGRLTKLCCLTPQISEVSHSLAASNAEGNQEEAKPPESPKLLDYLFIARAIDRTMFYVTVVMAIIILIYSFH